MTQSVFLVFWVQSRQFLSPFPSLTPFPSLSPPLPFPFWLDLVIIVILSIFVYSGGNLLYFCELFGFLHPGLEGRIRIRRLYSHVCLVMIPYLVTVVIVDILGSLWPSEVCLPCATIVTATR